MKSLKTTISRDKLFTSLEWVLSIGLCIVACWFASDVMDQFVARKTSFSQHEEPMTEYPAIIIQFPLKPSEVNFSDIKIKYQFGGMQKRELSIGKNCFSRPGLTKTEDVSLESFEMSYSNNIERRAFRIIHLTPMDIEKNGEAKTVIEVYDYLEKNSDKSKSWKDDGRYTWSPTPKIYSKIITIL